MNLYRKYADHVVANDGDVESCVKGLIALTEEF